MEGVWECIIAGEGIHMGMEGMEELGMGVGIALIIVIRIGDRVDAILKGSYVGSVIIKLMYCILCTGYTQHASEGMHDRLYTLRPPS
jgi:hypothetical protein